MSEIKRYRKALAEIRILAADMFTDHTRKIEAIADAALEDHRPVSDNRPKLAPRQAEILAYIAQHRDAYGYSPTVREIGQAVGITSPNGVSLHTNALIEKGYLRRSSKQARSFVPVEAS